MKRIDAWWDTRSLGVPCAEIVLEADDSEESLQEAIYWARSYNYVVLKTPAGNSRSAFLAQENGFRYIESSLGVTIDLDNMTFPPFVARREKAFSCKAATAETKERIFTQIRNGIFDSDRIALDPHFGPEVAATRYINWISDELDRGSSLYHVFYKNEEIAFFTIKELEPALSCYPFLTGLYPEWRNSGLGANATVAIASREGQRLGYHKVHTHISSNNLPVVRLHELFGFKIDAIDHVFVRHGRAHETNKDID